MLKTMSENPAFEWNAKVERTDQLETDTASLAPLLQNVKLRLMAAPAIVYRKASKDFLQEYLVAGISIELNTLTDLSVQLSLQQAAFLQGLQTLLTKTRQRQPEQDLKDPAVLAKLQRLQLEYIVPLEILLTCNSLKIFLYETEVSSSSRNEPKFQPLVCAVLNQPHIFCSMCSSMQKLSMSVYTMSLHCGDSGGGAAPLSLLPTLGSYPSSLLETLPGKADPVSGIRPAFCTLALMGFMTQNMTVEASIDRPVRMVLNGPRLELLSRLNRMLPVRDGQMEMKDTSAPFLSRLSRLETRMTVGASLLVAVEGGTAGPRPVALKVHLSRLDLSSDSTFDQNGVSSVIKLSLSHINASLGLEKNNHSLLDPLNMTVRAELLHSLKLLPVKGQISVSCGRLLCHIGPHHLHILETLHSDIVNILTPSPSIPGQKGPSTSSGVEVDGDVGEAFYDDLRLGTFSFSEDPDARRSIPPPYQAVYGPNTLTWSYPKPRTLTKMVILPVPLTLALGNQEGAEAGLECQLLLWSRIRSCWALYQSFRLQECNVTHVDLPLFSDRSCEYAETWRLEVFPFGNIRTEICCSLVSAMRVDSFYSRRMLPNFQVVLDIKSLSLVLHNHLAYAATQLGGEWRGLTLEPNYPRDQPFLRCLADSLSAEFCMWRPPGVAGGLSAHGAIKSNVKFRASVYYTDMSYLAQHTLLAPTEVALKVQLENQFADLFADLGPAEVSFGAFAIHVVRQSRRLWQQVERRLVGPTEEEELMVPLAQLMVVNESSQSLVYGQAHTEETLRISSKRLAMYCWRSQKTRYR